MHNLKAVCLAFGLTCLAASPALLAEDGRASDVTNLSQLETSANWCLRLPKEPMVNFTGVASLDNAGSRAGSMLYPAPNAAGLLAAILTHSIIIESEKANQKSKLQMEADKVLIPYQSVLNSYTQRELMQRGLSKTVSASRVALVDETTAPNTEWYMESVPAFSMTQDQRAIILENTISIFPAGTSSTPAYQNTVKVISPPQTNTDLNAFWNANQGEQLKEISAGLFSESLTLVLRDLASTKDQANLPQKTVRYLEGGQEKMERGEVVTELCDRIVIKTLRGWLMSIPPRRTSSQTAPACKNVAAQSL